MMNECDRLTTCYDCDNTECGHHGDKGADCPKYRCDNVNLMDCEHCEFIDGWIEWERKQYNSLKSRH